MGYKEGQLSQRETLTNDCREVVSQLELVPHEAVGSFLRIVDLITFFKQEKLS